jgi:carboxyl-terminal processing protease
MRVKFKKLGYCKLMSNIFTPCNQLHSSGTFAFWQKLVLISIFSLTLVPHVFAADAVITEPSQFNSGGLVNAIPVKDTEEEILSAPTLSPLDIHPRTSLIVVEQLRRNHYLNKTVDDELSEHVFDKYLAVLDPGHYYFIAGDIREFEKYRFRLDDALKSGDLDPAFLIFNRYQQRIVERLNYLIGLIDSGLENLDFSKEESILVSREEASWSFDEEAQDDLWRRRLKAQVLSMKLSDKPVDEISEQLRKRYRNQLKITVRNKSEDAFQAYINAFAHTYDPHTEYFSPRTSENFNINMSLSLEGIGAVLRTEDDNVEVVRLVPAGPAAKGGELKPADKITAVGQGIAGPLIDVVGWRLDDVVELIRGPKDSTVRLSIIPADSKEAESKNITIVRNKIKLEEQAAKAKTITLEPLGEEQPRLIGVIEIPTFYADFAAQQQGDPNYRSTTRDVRRLVEALKAQGIDGLVIDLRSNGGGSLQEADTMTGLFIPSGPTVQVKSARRRANILSDDNLELAWDGPMAVMVNRLSASASEIFAGALQDYGRALVVGNQTFGKGTVQTLIPLNRGQLKLTAAKFYRISGDSTQHQGVIPDIRFPALVDNDVIGESTLDDAMPWDKIRPANYRPYGALTNLVPRLQEQHDNRADNDPHFIYYRTLTQRSQEKSAIKFLSLNENARKEERTKDDVWRLDLENALRIATGKETAETLDALEELHKAENEAKEEAKNALAKADEADVSEQQLGASAQIQATEEAKDVIEEVKEDPLLREAGRILSDLVNEQRPNASSSPTLAKGSSNKTGFSVFYQN